MAQLDGVIAKLVDKDGEVKFPVTNTKAVETSDGRNLEEIVEIVDNMPNIATGIANTVFDTRIVEVNTEMQELKQLNTVVGNNTRDINTIQNQLTQHLGENSNSFLTIDNNINEIRGIISVQGTSLEEQKIRITDIEDALPNIKEVIDSAEELTTTIDNMGQQIDSNNEQIDSINEQIESINGQVDSINEQIDSIEGQIDSINKQVDSINEQIDSLEGQIDSINKQVDSINEQIDSLDTQVNSIEDDMGTPKYVDCVVHGNTSRIGLQEDAQVVNLKDGYVKNITLKGNTLVNLAKVKTTNQYNICSEKNISVKPNTKYIALFDGFYDDTYGANYALIVTSSVFINTIKSGDDLYTLTAGAGKGTEHIPSKGASHLIFTTKEDEYYIHIRTGGTYGVVYDNMMILEYQDGMENWDIPYFEGMQSVEQPTLTTTGKNLFDIDNPKNMGQDYKKIGSTITCLNTTQPVFGYENLDKNKTYTLSFDFKLGSEDASTTLAFSFSDKKQVYNPSTSYFVELKGSYPVGEVVKIKVPISNKSSIWVQGGSDTHYSNIQIEEGSIATEYEPYKSNILSTPAVLRSLPNGVYDTLNLNTGEYVKRIGEIRLDGSETWFMVLPEKTNTTAFYSEVTKEYAKKFDDRRATGEINCDKFPWSSVDLGREGTDDIEGIYTAFDGNICIAIAKSKLSTVDANGLEQYLQSNPTTVQYELESPTTEILGTKNKFYLYENGHVHVSAKNSFIIPEVTYTASTNFRGQIDIVLDKNNSLLSSSIESELAYPYTIVKRNGNGEVKTNTAFQYSDNTSIRHISESSRIQWGNSTGWYNIHDQETLPTEKGTWTPYCYCDNDGVKISLSNAFGTYSRVGDIVLIQGRVTGIMPETSQGAFRVGGLPYICRGSNTGVTIGYSKGIFTGNGYQLYARIESGSSIISLVSGSIANNSVGGSLITNAQVANFDFMFSATIKLTEY